MIRSSFHPPRWLQVGLLALVAVALGTACASPPPKKKGRTVLLSEEDAVEDTGARVTRRQAPLRTSADDARVGKDAYEQVAAEMGLLGDPALDAYVDEIGQRLLRGVPRQGFRYRFAVVDQIEPNAFALPGGYVFISRGLLALVNTEDELANVIGHEITHAASRHAAARQAQAQAQNPLTMPWLRASNMAAYSRDMERDADRGGQLLAAAAGYDPMGMSTFMGRLGQMQRLETGPRGPSFFDSHPGSVERASINSVRASEIRWRRDPARGDTRVAHLRRVEGMPVGPRREGGVFEGDRFLHPGLGFQMNFPEGWRMQNTNQAVGAISRHRDAVVYLTADLLAGELETVAAEFVERETQGRASIKDSRAVKLGRLDAWRIEFEAGSQQGTVLVMSTFFAFRDATWRITGMAPRDSAGRHRGRILATMRSFRPLSAQDAARIAAARLRVVEALPGEDLEALRKRTGSDWSRIRMAVINGLDANRRFAGGELVKIATRETGS